MGNMLEDGCYTDVEGVSRGPLGVMLHMIWVFVLGFCLSGVSCEGEGGE